MSPAFAAVYVRVSSEMQLDGRSLSEQEAICRDYCDRHGLAVVQLYCDEAKSASTTDRPEFVRMMSDAAAGLFGAIVFYHTWRFSRNTEDGALMRRLEARGVQLVSVSEGIDTKTASGKFQRNITLAVGEYQLDQLRDATRMGKQARASDGLSNASKPPFGYRREFEVKDAATKAIIGRDVPSEDAPIVRELFERYSTGTSSVLDLAKWLNSQGKTTTGNWGKRPFGKDTVAAMLKNGFYAGFVAYRGLSDAKSADGRRHLRNAKRLTLWKPGAHEALISVELWETCQHVRASRRGASLGGQRPTQQRVFMFAKMAYCVHCGGRLRGARWGEAGTTNEDNAYRCTAGERGCTCGATRRLVPERALLPDLDSIIARLRLPAEVKAIAAALIEGQDTTGADDRRRAKLQAELQRLNRIYQAGNMEDAAYDAEAARIHAELAAVAQLNNPAPRVDVQAAIDALDNMYALWGEATKQERAAIVGSLFESFQVNLDTRQLHSFKPKNDYAALLQAAYHMSGSDGPGFNPCTSHPPLSLSRIVVLENVYILLRPARA